ncbi:hypothetical protein Sjap_019455 [Stephania japonica]|uniref:MAR-binding filament-like protein 1-1 n=1 Tax=Stephania japonica TaxID=461633 RepID=A0AAP0EYU5_9MAGN
MGSLQFLSPSLLPSSSLLCSHSKRTNKGRRPGTVACRAPDTPNEVGFLERRSVLVLGVSALSFLQLRATAVETQLKGASFSVSFWNPDGSFQFSFLPIWVLHCASRIVVTRVLNYDLYESIDISAVPDKGNADAVRENQQVGQAHDEAAPSNPLLSFLNVIGIIGSGVLASLYSLAQKEKKASGEIIESLKKRITEKELAAVSLEKDFEKKLLHEKEERAKQIRKAKEEERFLSNQLSAANNTVAGLRQEIKNEKHLVETMKAEIGKLQGDLSKLLEDNKVLKIKLKEKVDFIEVQQDRLNLLGIEMKDKEDNIRKLNSLLAEKESECKSLNSIYEQAKIDLAKANSEIVVLKEEVLKAQKDLDSKNAAIDDLNKRMNSLAAENDEMNRNIESLKVDYHKLKSGSEREAALAAELVTKKDHELQQLEEKLRLTLQESSRKQELVADISRERDDLKTALETEVNKVNMLSDELQITKEALDNARSEASELSKQLKVSRKLCEELTSEISKIQFEFTEARHAFERTLEEARSSSNELSSELASVKKALEKSKDEIQAISNELKLSNENSENLKKELLDAYKEAETAANDLNEERKIIETLHKELEVSEKQMLQDREARQNLQTDLEEATRSLDELNRNVLMLSRELDMEKGSVASLEAEKEMLYESLVDQKKASKEAQENVEDAHNLIMKLGKEKENLEKKVKKLDEEMASAKGEILRLRSKMNSTKSPVHQASAKKSSNDDGNAAVTAKRSGGRRRRKSEPPSEPSQ